jgi:hypothetical protein
MGLWECDPRDMVDNDLSSPVENSSFAAKSRHLSRDISIPNMRSSYSPIVNCLEAIV